MAPGLLGLAVAALLLPQRPAGAPAGYAQVDEGRIRDILSQMTLSEKLDETGIPTLAEPDFAAFRLNPLDAGKLGPWPRPESWFDLKDNVRLGLRGMRTRDGPRGITCMLGDAFPFGHPCPEGGVSPAFPHENIRAATWDVALEEEFGAATGEIAKLLDIHAALMPCINILPWLNAGRGQESYGEDPFFNGKMGAGAVRGVQSKGVMATPKHFLANNIENTRWYVSADMDDKLLHEVYLKQWAVIIAESAPEFIMTSYNRVQGNWSNIDPKFIRLLREKLGFQGSIMTDWLATMTMSVSVLSGSPFSGQDGFFGGLPTVLTAGVDLEMPFNSRHAQAVRQLAACEASDAEMCHTANMLDRAVGHLLRSKLRYGLSGAGAWKPNHPNHPAAAYDNSKYSELALKIAQRGIVLLRNEGGLLPKRPAEVSSVVVLGSPDELELGDRGSSAQRPSGKVMSVLDGLVAKYGYGKVKHLRHDQATSDVVRQADLVILDVGLNWTFEGEYIPPNTGGDRKYLTLHGSDLKLIYDVASVNSNVVVAMTSGQNILVENFVDSVPAILWLGYPGSMGGQALADILAGDVNPSGRMTSATPKRPSDWVPSGITLEPWNAGPNVKYPYAHGFKHMWGEGIAPRYPIGWGLSYTSFECGAPSLSASKDGLDLAVRAEVKNVGSRAGIETIQVYATCLDCEAKRLPILLVGFAKITLAAGEQGEALVSVSAREFAVYDVASSKWVLEKGSYELLVGPYADASKLHKLVHTVAEDFSFDYAGAATAPHVPGVGVRECGSFACAPDADFNNQLWVAVVKARAVMLGLVALLLFVIFAVVRLCQKLCRACCCPSKKKEKAKAA